MIAHIAEIAIAPIRATAYSAARSLGRLSSRQGGRDYAGPIHRSSFDHRGHGIAGERPNRAAAKHGRCCRMATGQWRRGHNSRSRVRAGASCPTAAALAIACHQRQRHSAQRARPSVARIRHQPLYNARNHHAPAGTIDHRMDPSRDRLRNLAFRTARHIERQRPNAASLSYSEDAGCRGRHCRRAFRQQRGRIAHLQHARHHA